MDGNRFDDLSRTLAAGLSRRSVLAGAASALLGAVGLRRGAGAQVSQAQCGNRTCRRDPGVCADGCVCCVYANGNSRCRPPGACGPGQEVCPLGEVPDPVRGCIPGDCAAAADCGADELCCGNVCSPVGSDPTACGCARERCPVNEVCIAGGCTCVLGGFPPGNSAAPSTCCANAICAGPAVDPTTCTVVVACPPGSTLCVGALCRACCPPGTTCDPRQGICRQWPVRFP